MQDGIARLLVATCAMALSSAAVAEVKVASLFSDNMVLQRELPVPVWGTASPGEKITVSFAGQRLSATADEKGGWMVKLSPLGTSKTGRNLVVRGSNTVTFSGVLVGEVWLCSGQSNMAGKFVASKGRRIEAKAFEMDLSGFRFSARRGWYVLSQRSQGLLSRVAYYFGIELYKELKVPVGLILRYHSGTPVQAWMPKDASEVIRKKLAIPEGWNDA
ncbi:MAG: sialate O-acetylesterase, partial [Planctomycetota bacterium]